MDMKKALEETPKSDDPNAGLLPQPVQEEVDNKAKEEEVKKDGA